MQAQNDIGHLNVETQHDQHLRTIKSDDDSQLVHGLVNTATFWALSGYIEETNGLLEQAWKYKLINPDNLDWTVQRFYIMWHLSAKYPVGIPLTAKDLNLIEQDNWEKLFYPGIWSPLFTDQFADKPLQDLTGDQLSTRAIIMAYDADAKTHRASHERQLESLKALTRYIETAKENVGMQVLACAAIIAANHQSQTAAEVWVQKWGVANTAASLYGKGYFDHLLNEQVTARILLKGILSPILGLTKRQCQQQLAELTVALDSRMANGQSLAYGQLSTKQLMQRLSEIAIQLDKAAFDKAAVKSGWLGVAPATDRGILESEGRLNVHLPASYKQFLKVTNGFPALSSVGVTLLPVEKIGLFKDYDPETVEEWATDGLFGDSASVAAFANSILIGGLGEEQQLLLVPPYNNIHGWSCWFFSFWGAGETRYPDFRYWQEHELEFLTTHL